MTHGSSASRLLSSACCRPLAVGGATLLLAAAACGSDDADDNSNNGPQPICTAPTEVACADQVITDLFLYGTTAPGIVSNSADGTDIWASEIDATAGGMSPTESFVYTAFTDQGLVKLDLNDKAAINDMSWDIAFRRYVIRINSGDSGPSCTSATPLPSTVTFDSVLSVPPDLTYAQDDFETSTCTLIQDGAGLGAPAVVMGPFYKTYMATTVTVIQMTNRVFVLQLKSGRHVRLVVTHYYLSQYQEAANTDPDHFSPMGKGAGNVGIRWAFLD
jgi:hypothetical protein